MCAGWTNNPDVKGHIPIVTLYAVIMVTGHVSFYSEWTKGTEGEKRLQVSVFQKKINNNMQMNKVVVLWNAKGLIWHQHGDLSCSWIFQNTIVRMWLLNILVKKNSVCTNVENTWQLDASASWKFLIHFELWAFLLRTNLAALNRLPFEWHSTGKGPWLPLYHDICSSVAHFILVWNGIIRFNLFWFLTVCSFYGVMCLPLSPE